MGFTFSSPLNPMTFSSGHTFNAVLWSSLWKKDEIMHEPNSSLPKDIVKETNLYDQNNYRLHSS